MTLLGHAAPDFELKDDQGDVFKLSQALQQSAVMLVFYPGDFKPVCTRQLCSYQDAYDRFRKYGVTPVGISFNSGGEHQKFKDAYGISYPLLSDPDKKVFREYQVTSLFMLGGSTRAVFVVSKQGRVLYRHVEATTVTRRKPEELIAALDLLRIKGSL